MKTILPLEDCSISQLFLEGVEKYHYSIPIYQRNYAWGESEIKTLINWTTLKLRTSVHQNIIKRAKRQATEWNKICAVCITDKGL